MIKVRLQSPAYVELYKSTADALLSTLRTEGAAALYLGIEAQVWRNSVWAGIYFSVIQELKNSLPTPKSDNQTLLRNFAAGVVGGTLAT